MGQVPSERHPHLVSEGETTDDERALFNRLKRNNWRIEQERLAGEWVKSQLEVAGAGIAFG